MERKVTDPVLVRHILKGLNPSIFPVFPTNEGPWTFHQVDWFADILDKFLPKSDPHCNQGNTSGPEVLPDCKVTFNCVPSPSLSSELKNVCYRCQSTGYFAYDCKRKRFRRQQRRI